QVIDAAGPGDGLVIDNAGHCVSTFGGLATLAAKLKGIAGLIVDGGVRDREEVGAHQFPVCAGGPGTSWWATGRAWCAFPPNMRRGSWSWPKATPRTTRWLPPSSARGS